jgi:ABC-type lipoprotein release transport system permease subunit
VLSAGAAHLLTAEFPTSERLGPGLYATIAPLLCVIAMLAAYVPARRAALLHPMSALREE